MMSHAGLSKMFWRHALQTASYNLNQVSTNSVLSTSYEKWKGRKSNLSHMKIWGCPTYVAQNMSDKL